VHEDFHVLLQHVVGILQNLWNARLNIFDVVHGNVQICPACVWWVWVRARVQNVRDF
jgi:hypothetical protein